MIPRVALSCLALTGAALALQGCVVAAAAPLAAAGVAIRQGSQDRAARPAARPVAPAKATAKTPRIAGKATSSEQVFLTNLTQLAAPTARDVGESDPTFRAFADHALMRARPGSRIDDTRSAILSAPGNLDGRRAACGSRPAMVLIDLDPARGAFDPLVPAEADPALVEALAQLRQREVTVTWQTRLGEGFEDAIRQVLAETGLDPAGTDRLEVLRSLDERKQTRRDALARTHCIVAMLGDDRADFDELYLYLKDPAAAVPLDAMIGRGWFLAEPIASEG